MARLVRPSRNNGRTCQRGKEQAWREKRLTKMRKRRSCWSTTGRKSESALNGSHVLIRNENLSTRPIPFEMYFNKFLRHVGTKSESSSNISTRKEGDAIVHRALLTAMSVFDDVSVSKTRRFCVNRSREERVAMALLSIRQQGLAAKTSLADSDSQISVTFAFASGGNTPRQTHRRLKPPAINENRS